MAGKTEINEDALLTFVKQSDGPVQRHQALLGKLRAVQLELKSAFKGQAGEAVGASFDNTIRTGEAVGQKHEQIIEMVLNTNNKFAQQDADAMSAVTRMNADLGSIGAGSIDGTTSTGSVAETMLANPKVKTDF